MSQWTKIPYEVGKRTVGAVRKMSLKKTANTALNVATGATVASMIPLSAGTSTDHDIERIQQFGDGRQPLVTQTADSSRGRREL